MKVGIDACVYFKTASGHEPDLSDPLPRCCDIVKAHRSELEGATHRIENNWRYYGPGCERGNWPEIAAALMVLHACADIETVWYFGDNLDSADPFTPEDVATISMHYMMVGHRPYLAADTRVP